MTSTNGRTRRVGPLKLIHAKKFDSGCEENIVFLPDKLCYFKNAVFAFQNQSVSFCSAHYDPLWMQVISRFSNKKGPHGAEIETTTTLSSAHFLIGFSYCSTRLSLSLCYHSMVADCVADRIDIISCFTHPHPLFFSLSCHFLFQMAACKREVHLCLLFSGLRISAHHPVSVVSGSYPQSVGTTICHVQQ